MTGILVGKKECDLNFLKELMGCLENFKFLFFESSSAGPALPCGYRKTETNGRKESSEGWY